MEYGHGGYHLPWTPFELSLGLIAQKVFLMEWSNSIRKSWIKQGISTIRSIANTVFFVGDFYILQVY